MHPAFFAACAVAINVFEPIRTTLFLISNDLKIISMVYSHSFASDNLVNISPLDFIYLIKNADIFFTNMFHGTIYAAKYSSHFCFDYSEYRKNKFSYIYKALNLISNEHSRKKYDIKQYQNNSKVKIRSFSQNSKNFLDKCFE